MKHVGIIGGGITGLTAAFYLKRNGVPVTLYEASGRVGGVIQSLRQDGYVAEFVIRRLGQEFLDHAIDALVAGIYAGDPYKLSVPHALPKLAQLEARYGSLIKGQILGAWERKKRGEIAKDRAPKFSFDEGVQVLTETLEERLGESVCLNTSVTKIAQTPAGWALDLRQGARETRAEHSAVIYAGTAFRLAELKL